MAGLYSSLTLLLSLVLVLALAAAPAQAWRNVTRSINVCSFGLYSVYLPSESSNAPLELDNSTASALFQSHLRQSMASLIASNPENPIHQATDPLAFANSLHGWVDSVVFENGTNGLRLAQVNAYVEGSLESEWNCGFVVGSFRSERGPLGQAVAESVDQTYGAPTFFNESQFQFYRLNEYQHDRYYYVVVPSDEDLCTVSFIGTYQMGAKLDPDVERPPPSSVFNEEVAARVRLTYRQDVWFYAAPSMPYDPQSIAFNAQLSVLKNESVELTSLLAPAVMRTLERLTDAPYDSSELRINAQRSCYVPPPVWTARCVQVSAKLESGAPFALNSSAVNSSATIFSSFRNALNKAMGDQSVILEWDLQVQSVAAVPLEQADTLQVAVRVDFAVDEKEEVKGVSTIGRQVTSALETTAVEVSPSSLYEVAYTITPCHAPSSTFFKKRHASQAGTQQ